MSQEIANDCECGRSGMTHSAAVEAAGRWLKTFGCPVVLCELTACTLHGETPDAIGWKSGCSILIECKVSRADFLRDRKKLFRMIPENGMGMYRLYLCPEGLIKPEELPKGWGLLWVCGKRISRVVAPKGNYFPHNGCVVSHHDRDKDSEIAMLLSALRRGSGSEKNRHG